MKWKRQFLGGLFHYSEACVVCFGFFKYIYICFYPRYMILHLFGVRAEFPKEKLKDHCFYFT